MTFKKAAMIAIIGIIAIAVARKIDPVRKLLEE